MLRAFDLVHLSLSDGSIERQSTFAYARKQAVGGGTAAYDVDEWENQRVAEGSATVALTMAAGLSDVRLSTPVSRIAISSRGARVTTAAGEEIRADAVVLAVPSGPARDIEITGVSDERARPRCAASGTRGRPSSSRRTTGRSGATPGRTRSPRARA